MDTYDFIVIGGSLPRQIISHSCTEKSQLDLQDAPLLLVLREALLVLKSY
jgi:hypothetical protein